MIQAILRFFTLGIISVFSISLFAQETPPENIEGQQLRTWLKQYWYDNHENISGSASSGYRAARLEMYNKIDVVNGQLEGFYSGYTINVPSQGFDAPADISPMDCEHIVPQSLFDSDAPMKNDIFHLRPTYSNWNSTRGNLPFDENPDLQTDKWMRFDDNITCNQNPSCIPNESIIDEFSEVINGQSWEPREKVKGNVARAVFYFFTMYPQYNITSVGDIEQLYLWHLEDPADAFELSRNDMVEDFQGNRNPYIDYADLVQKAWLPDYEVPVETSNSNISERNVKVFPIPASESINVELDSGSDNIELIIYDYIGRQLPFQLNNDYDNTTLDLDISNLQPGTYFLTVKDKYNVLGVVKFLKQ